MTMADAAEGTLERVLCWLRDKRDDADKNCNEVAEPTRSYWLGKWAAFSEAKNFIENGE